MNKELEEKLDNLDKRLDEVHKSIHTMVETRLEIAYAKEELSEEEYKEFRKRLRHD